MTEGRTRTRVYFLKPIGMDGPIKIGCSKTPIARELALSHWSPFPLELIADAPGSFKIERRLHDHFRALNSHGEWFATSDELMAGIQAVKDGASIEEAFFAQTRALGHHPISGRAAA